MRYILISLMVLVLAVVLLACSNPGQDETTPTIMPLPTLPPDISPYRPTPIEPITNPVPVMNEEMVT